jgi:hypothetical protein
MAQELENSMETQKRASKSAQEPGKIPGGTEIFNCAAELFQVRQTGGADVPQRGSRIQACGGEKYPAASRELRGRKGKGRLGVALEKRGRGPGLNHRLFEIHGVPSGN